jgi:hypothetical protein
MPIYAQAASKERCAGLLNNLLLNAVNPRKAGIYALFSTGEA